MNLAELLNSGPPIPDLQPFITTSSDRRMPPLSVSQLTIERLVGSARTNLRTAVCGDASLLLRYKSVEGAVTSLKEDDDGETWSIVQVQGAKSKKSYRVASGMNWQGALAHDIYGLTTHPDASVKRLVMPPLFGIKGVNDAESDSIDATYARVRNTLKMRFSEELRLFIRDIN